MSFNVDLHWDPSVFGKDLNRDNKLHRPPALTALEGEIAKIYREMPWPSSVTRVGVITEDASGRGDWAAGAKVINLLQELHPTLEISWATRVEGMEFLTHPEKVKRRNVRPDDTREVDLVIGGPTKTCKNLSGGYISNNGPRVNFFEIASDVNLFADQVILYLLQKWVQENKPYSALHDCILPTNYDDNGIVMNLVAGSGVFIDQERVNAPRSMGYYGPEYIDSLEDLSLKEEILKHPGAALYSGYAHRPTSVEKFVEFVGLLEESREVVIVLNEGGVKPELLGHLPKNVTLITRSKFSPHDMKCLQLASEGILATGDNTACEAFAAKCAFYLYEDVANGGTKKEFLQQQIAIARQISPDLARLLELGGQNRPLTADEREEAKRILKDPYLKQHTVQFCETITTHYSFAPF